jgi:ribosomal-protein-alanine N-acetyltransferase
MLKKNPSIKISKIKPIDINTIIYLSKSIPLAWNKKMWQNEINSSTSYYLAAKNGNGKMLGFCGMNCILDEGHIVALSIDNKFRRKKIGTLLTLDILNRARRLHLKRVLLEVAQKNLAAVDLYLKLGFEILNFRKNYYPNGENALVMEKTL